MELESFQSGVLLYIGQKEGAVPVDGIIAIIGAEGEDYEAQLKEAQAVRLNQQFLLLRLQWQPQRHQLQ